MSEKKYNFLFNFNSKIISNSDPYITYVILVQMHYVHVSVQHVATTTVISVHNSVQQCYATMTLMSDVCIQLDKNALQGASSFETLIFHDFSMTKK